MLAGFVFLVVVLLALLPAAEGVGIVSLHVDAEVSSILVGLLPLRSFLTEFLILCSLVCTFVSFHQPSNAKAGCKDSEEHKRQNVVDTVLVEFLEQFGMLVTEERFHMIGNLVQKVLYPCLQVLFELLQHISVGIDTVHEFPPSLTVCEVLRGAILIEIDMAGLYRLVAL